MTFWQIYYIFGCGIFPLRSETFIVFYPFDLLLYQADITPIMFKCFDLLVYADRIALIMFYCFNFLVNFDGIIWMVLFTFSNSVVFAVIWGGLSAELKRIIVLNNCFQHFSSKASRKVMIKELHHLKIMNIVIKYTVSCLYVATAQCMLTSSNGNIFRFTGPWCGEFTNHRWIPLTKASDVELWCFLWSVPE